MNHLIYCLILALFISCVGGGTSGGSSSSSDDSVSTIPEVSVDCRVDGICSTGGAADEATAIVAFIKDSCADFGSTSAISAIGETSPTCNSDTCTYTVNTWTGNGSNITTLSDGSYSVVMYIDTDQNGAPNSGDPYRCADGHSVGSSSTSISETINSTM